MFVIPARSECRILYGVASLSENQLMWIQFLMTQIDNVIAKNYVIDNIVETHVVDTIISCHVVDIDAY